MADRPFDRTILNPLEKPLADDWNQAQSQIDAALREVLMRVFGGRAAAGDDSMLVHGGFVGDGFRVKPATGMTVQLVPGLGFQYLSSDVAVAIDGVIGTDDRHPFKPLMLNALQGITIATAPVGPNTRIDIIEVRTDRRRENSLQREKWNGITEAFDPFAFLKTLAFALDGRVGTVTAPANSTTGIGYKIGIAGNPGAVPATTAGYVKIAEVRVPSAGAAVAESWCGDFRPLVLPSNILQAFVVYRVPNTTGLATLDSLIAPAGVRVSVAQGSAPFGGDHFLYVVAGGGPTGTPKVNLQTTIVTPTGAVAGLANLSAAWRLVNGTIQTLLADATKSVPALNVAIGQPIIQVQMNAFGTTGGVPDGATAGDPVVYNTTITTQLQ